MYAQPRPLNTTLYGVREKGLRYFVDLDSETRKTVKSVVFKTDVCLRTLVLKNNRYLLQLTSADLQNMLGSVSFFPYSLVITYKDGHQETISGTVIVR